MILDHLYIGISSTEFKPTLELTNLFQGCQHINVQSGSDSWEGVYLFSEAGPYFEILNERRRSGLGIAFRTELETNAIVAKRPDLKWVTGTRQRSDGSPWFDWTSLGEYLNVRDTWFNAWTMRYYENVKPRSTFAFSVKRFLSLTMTLGKERLQEMRDLSQWFPHPLEVSSDSALIRAFDRDGNEMKVQIHLEPGSAKFAFQKLDFELSDATQLSDRDLGYLKYTQNGNLGSLTLIGK